MAERVYWDSDDVRVTSASVTHRDVMYPLSVVHDVSLREVPVGTSPEYSGNRDPYWALGVMSIPMLLMGAIGLLSSYFIPGIAFLVLGASFLAAAIYFRNEAINVKKTFDSCILRLGTASGKEIRVTLTSVKAGELRSAIDRAIADRESGGGGRVSVAEELEKLSALRDSGVLASDDWERAKSLFLGKQPDARDEAISHLRKLHDLHRDGVLSESEFNSKKWDILAKRE